MAAVEEMKEKPSEDTDASLVEAAKTEGVDGESQERCDTGDIRSISDDQKLFLKVLENLKNAVNTKPDKMSVALPKNVKESSKSQALLVTSKASDDAGISRTDSSVRSDTEEPGTTTVTVSDKTKSLILQKLAVASEIDKSKLGAFSSFVISNPDSNAKICDDVEDKTKNTTAANQKTESDMKVELVKLTVMGFEANTKKTGDKDILNVKKVNKENVDLQTDNVVSASTSPKMGRLIAPATPSVKLFTCNFCDYYSENKNYLKQHIDLVHNPDRPFKCPYCDYAGKRSHALREHLIVHSNERPYQCKSCNATFRKKGHLTNHIKLHNSKRLVKCPLCKVLVYDTGENGLDVHLLNDHDTERLYGCDLCDHIAANEPGILKHLNEKHKSKISLHKCDKCPFQTANKQDFDGHAQAHNITEGKVQIGSNTPTKVIGVATIPAGSHNIGIPNSVVKLDPAQDEPGKQPAVIKPVWIKCSECGFTGQDSEVIRKHMIEHLKEQYGVDLDTEIELPIPSNPPKGVPTTQAVSKAVTQPPAPKTKASTPILVPVTKKLDMNAPVLVPVSEAILKSIQSVPVSVLQLAPTGSSPVVAKPINSSLQTNRKEGKNVPFSNTVTLSQSDTAIKPAVTMSVPQLKLLPNVPTNKLENTHKSVAARKVSAPAQFSEIQGLTNLASCKVTPVKLTTSDGTVLTNSVNVKMSSTGPSSIVPPTDSNSATKNLSSCIESTTLPRTEPVTSFTLTEIPVPRSLNASEIPKLPQKLIQLSSTPAREKQPVAAVEVETTGAEDEQNILQKCQNIKALEESIAQVQKMIDQQDDYNRKVGNAPSLKLDARGKTSGQKVVYYMTPVGKHNTSRNKFESGFIHDHSAGRFRCTLCGYTCEYQRTIKAHIWKHSGNKDIYYPMFQNGPLSIYEDGNFIKSEQEENIIEVPTENPNETTHVPMPELSVVSEDAPEGKLPSFIVYEQTKISNVAPALAHLIAARTMVGLKDVESVDNVSATSGELLKNAQRLIKVNDNISICVTEEQWKSIEEFRELEKNKLNPVREKQMLKETDAVPTVSANVIVEAVHGVNTTGFTGLQSQQSSPRVTPAPKSPDSGVSEPTAISKLDERSTSSGFISPLPNFDYIADESGDSNRNYKIHTNLEEIRSQPDKSATNAPDDTEEGPPAKKAKVSNHEDSAVTLLSLLKKGPNFNPACPPKTGQIEESQSEETIIKPGQDDVNSFGESDASSLKPKSGISTSLLAVIEQLRERSKTEPEDEKCQNGLQGKKQSKRRSRKSSLEDNAPAAGIDNVEEFVADGQVKFRCKLCHYTNDSTMLLRQHMRLHKPKQEFECSLCDHIAESSEALQDHMIQHCKVRIYQCKLCNCAFNYKSQLRAHMRMHNDQDILLCDFCDFETRSVSALKAHTKSHLTKPPYKCEMCKEEFITSFNLRIHKREGCYTSVDKGGNFKCDECDYTTMYRREMKNHQRLHMGKSTIPTKKRCPYCDNVAMTIEQIQQHIADVHGESKPLKCEMCGFVAVSIRSLKSHMKRHVNDQRFVAQPLEQYKCNLCGYVCHHLPSLKSHMWRHAADEHYSYEFTNDVINAAIDFDGQTEAVDTTLTHVENFKKFIFDKMKAKGLEHTRSSEEESALACCWVTFRCCQCGFETINKAELNMHMAAHSDVIKWTLDVPEDDRSKSKQVTQILHG